MNLLFTCRIQFVQTDLAEKAAASSIARFGGYLPMKLVVEGMFYSIFVALKLCFYCQYQLVCLFGRIHMI